MAHVEKRGKTSWRLVVTIGYDDKGVPIRERKTVQARNKTEAEKLLTIFEAEILTGNYVKVEKITFKKLFEEWDKNVTSDDLADRTKDGYKTIIERRILPKYGHMKLEDIKPIHVLNFVNSLKKDGARLDGKPGKLATSTINNCYKAFNSVLDFAERMNWIPENPASKITTPSVKHAETSIYEPHELTKLTEGLATLNISKRWHTLISLSLASSARQGEIAALEAKHVDFKRSGIHIKQSLAIKKGVGVILKETKNKRNRFVTLPKVVMDMLKELIEIRENEASKVGDHEDWEEHLFLFADELGKPIRPDSISQWWMRFMKSKKFKTLGLKEIRFHDLRHSSLTFLSSQGMRAKAVQERAGHAKIGTTFDIYGHVLEKEENEAAEHVGKIFGS